MPLAYTSKLETEKVAITLIINRRSGSWWQATAPESVARTLQAYGLSVTLVPVDRTDPAILARKAVREGARIIVAAGGDGTVSAVASALVDTEACLGVLPVGTLNHFAKDMKIPMDLAGAARVIAAGHERRVDVGEVNGRVFINNSGLGVYPRIVTSREEHRRKGSNKWFALFRAILVVLRRVPVLSLRVNTEDASILRRTPMIFVGNNEYQLQASRFGSRENLDRGRLFVYIAKARSGRDLVRLSLQALLGHARDTGDFDILDVSDALVETKRHRVRVSLDGEVVSMHTPLHYRIRPGALRVLAP